MVNLLCLLKVKLFSVFNQMINRHLICSVGSVKNDGKWKIVSVGILGKVFVLYKD